MAEAKEIQKRMRKTQNTKTEETREKAFVRLMLLGKIGPAAKYINNDDSVKGVHSLTDEIKEILQSKHPAGREADLDVICELTKEPPQAVIFEAITGDEVYKIAKNMNGSGGPMLIHSDTWKDFLCSKAHGGTSVELCQTIADLAKVMCTEDIHPDTLTEYIACRLIPLDKGLTKDLKPGVRPIGVGEVLKRIVGKLLRATVPKNQTVPTVGSLKFSHFPLSYVFL